MNAKNSYLTQATQLYGADPRELPLYSLSQASSHLKLPLATLRSWVKGRYYPVGKGEENRFFKPVIKLPDPQKQQLSFLNLVEAHVLGGIRRLENVPFYKIRNALEYIESAFPSPHPLADYQFQTDGVDLFIERLDQLIAVSRRGQIVIKEVLENYLRRIERDLDFSPLKLYPFTKPTLALSEPKQVLIDPLVSFGRPVIAGTGVPTAILAERFYAGESSTTLAEDYGITQEQVEAALRYEAPFREAA